MYTYGDFPHNGWSMVHVVGGIILQFGVSERVGELYELHWTLCMDIIGLDRQFTIKYMSSCTCKLELRAKL